jgi:hypothetical protein
MSPRSYPRPRRRACGHPPYSRRISGICFDDPVSNWRSQGSSVRIKFVHTGILQATLFKMAMACSAMRGGGLPRARPCGQPLTQMPPFSICHKTRRLPSEAIVCRRRRPQDCETRLRQKLTRQDLPLPDTPMHDYGPVLADTAHLSFPFSTFCRRRRGWLHPQPCAPPWRSGMGTPPLTA